MKKKNTIALIALGAVLIGGVVAGTYVTAGQVPWHANDIAAPFYQGMVARSSNPNQVLNDLAAWQAQRDAYDKLTPQQKQQQIDASDAKFKADMAARQAAQPQAVAQAATQSFTGLGDSDPLMPGMEFNQIQPAYWSTINGAETVVVSGNTQSDYTQGVVVVQTRGSNFSMNSYKTPTATGPVKIVSYNGTVITLQSQAGTWDQYDANADTHSKVTTKGGVTYKFDVAKRAFVQ